MTFLDPRFWLSVVISLLTGFGLGYHKGAKDKEAEQVKAAAKQTTKTLETERKVKTIQNKGTANYVAGVIRKERKAREYPPIIIRNDCAVPAAVGQLLNDAQQLPEVPGPESGIGSARPAVDSTCAAELEIAKRNYAEVCVPNAMQLDTIRQQWSEVTQELNK